jgi:hypothetical protein
MCYGPCHSLDSGYLVGEIEADIRMGESLIEQVPALSNLNGPFLGISCCPLTREQVSSCTRRVQRQVYRKSIFDIIAVKKACKQALDCSTEDLVVTPTVSRPFLASASDVVIIWKDGRECQSL